MIQYNKKGKAYKIYLNDHREQTSVVFIKNYLFIYFFLKFMGVNPVLDLNTFEK